MNRKREEEESALTSSYNGHLPVVFFFVKPLLGFNEIAFDVEHDQKNKLKIYCRSQRLHVPKK